MPDKLQQAISVILSGDTSTGRKLLAQIIKDDPKNETAWIWMATVIDDPARKRQCFEIVLSINPNNVEAKKGLTELKLASLPESHSSQLKKPKLDLAWVSGVQQTEVQRMNMGHKHRAIDVVVTPDNRYIISAGTEGLKVWSFQTGEFIHDIRSPAGFLYSVNMMPGGNYVVACCHHDALSESVVWISDIQTGSRVWESHEMVHLGKEAIALSEDLIVYTEQGAIYQWYWQTEKRPSLLTTNSSRIGRLRVTADNSQLIFIDDNDNLGILDVAKKQVVYSLSGYVDVALHPDGKRAVCKTISEQLCIISLQSGQVLQNLEGDEGISEKNIPIAITPDGQFAVTGQGHDAAIGVWDLSTGRLAYVLAGHEVSISGVAITSDSKYIITTGGYDKTIKIWELQTQECTSTLPGDYSYWYPVVVTPDNQYVISPANFNGRVLGIWDLQSGTLINTLTAHTNSVTRLALTPNGRYLVSASQDTTVRVWDVQTTQLLHTFKHSRSVILLAVTADGRQVISVETTGLIRGWSIETGEALFVLDSHRGKREVRSLTISPDNRYVVTTSRDNFNKIHHLDSFEHTLTIWDLQKAEIKNIFASYKWEWDIEAVTFTSDSRYVVCASSTMTVHTVDLQTGELPQLHLEANENNRRPNTLNAVIIIPNRHRLAAYKYQTGFKIFDLKTAKEIDGDTMESNLQLSRLSPDNQYVVVVSQYNEDRSVDIWNIETCVNIASVLLPKADVEPYSIIKDAAIAPNSEVILVTDSLGVLYCLRLNLL